MPHYINVYQDNKGGLHYSTEEFAVGMQGMTSETEALAEVEKFRELIPEWTYVKTLSDNTATTKVIDQVLREEDKEMFDDNRRETAKAFHLGFQQICRAAYRSVPTNPATHGKII